jgi:hypothetical protein
MPLILVNENLLYGLRVQGVENSSNLAGLSARNLCTSYHYIASKALDLINIACTNERIGILASSPGPMQATVASQIDASVSEPAMMSFGMYGPLPHGYPQYAYYASQPSHYASTHAKRHLPSQRTISIINFPEDAKERELNNLLLFFPGYQVRYSTLRFRLGNKRHQV